MRNPGVTMVKRVCVCVCVSDVENLTECRWWARAFCLTGSAQVPHRTKAQPACF